MKKNKLFVPHEYDFELLGITSSAKEYKLAWSINIALHIKFLKDEDLIINFNDGKQIIISNYKYKTENSILRLFRNKSYDAGSEVQNYLLPELRNFDFLVLVKGFEDTCLIEDLMRDLRGTPDIMYIQRIDIMNLKSKDNLIF